MSRLSSFSPPLRCAVIGASGGIGAALLAALLDEPRVAVVHALCRLPPALAAPGLHWTALDLADEPSIAAAAGVVGGDGPLDLVIVATGVLHDALARPEKRWEQISAEALAHLFAVNAIGPALCARHFLPLLRTDGKAVFAALSARVGSIADNRAGGWYGYRASKAALNQLLKTFALELARRRPRAVCIGLHPGTVDTPLSQPFQQRVPTDRLFSPERAAACLLEVIDQVSPADSGQVFAWDGVPVPP
jgi:NAD(P)-dependent dehydrogenase (short-subunit alcohol dehydrogenase family)